MVRVDPAHLDVELAQDVLEPTPISRPEGLQQGGALGLGEVGADQRAVAAPEPLAETVEVGVLGDQEQGRAAGSDLGADPLLLPAREPVGTVGGETGPGFVGGQPGGRVDAEVAGDVPRLPGDRVRGWCDDGAAGVLGRHRSLHGRLGCPSIVMRWRVVTPHPRRGGFG
jgi:hypothetical protein